MQRESHSVVVIEEAACVELLCASAREYTGAVRSGVHGQEWGWQWIRVWWSSWKHREEQGLCALELAMSGAGALGVVGIVW